jgi:hypothetical protein
MLKQAHSFEITLFGEAPKGDNRCRNVATAAVPPLPKSGLWAFAQNFLQLFTSVGRRL